jgi:hypothetical protein
LNGSGNAAFTAQARPAFEVEEERFEVERVDRGHVI